MKTYEHEQVHKIKDGRIKKSKAWKYCSKFYLKQLFHRLERLPANLVTSVETKCWAELLTVGVKIAHD